MQINKGSYMNELIFPRVMIIFDGSMLHYPIYYILLCKLALLTWSSSMVTCHHEDRHSPPSPLLCLTISSKVTLPLLSLSTLKHLCKQRQQNIIRQICKLCRMGNMIELRFNL